jgi:hypothetical protein
LRTAIPSLPVPKHLLVRLCPPMKGGRRSTCQRRERHSRPHASWRKAGQRVEICAKNAASPPALLSPRLAHKGAGRQEHCYRFQIIKTIAWQHSRFGSLAAYARSIPVLGKRNASVGVSRRKFAPMLGEGDPLSGLTARDSSPHKIAMTCELAAPSVVDRGSTCASASAPHASSE